jgi:hypothetical protein
MGHLRRLGHDAVSMIFDRLERLSASAALREKWFFMIVHSHANMFVPGVNDVMFAHARSNVSWTRSSAWSPLRHSEMAKARSRGIAASMALPTVGSSVLTCFPFERFRDAATALDSRSGRAEMVCIDLLDFNLPRAPAPSLLGLMNKSGLPVLAGIVA